MIDLGGDRMQVFNREGNCYGCFQGLGAGPGLGRIEELPQAGG